MSINKIKNMFNLKIITAYKFQFVYWGLFNLMVYYLAIIQN